MTFEREKTMLCNPAGMPIFIILSANYLEILKRFIKIAARKPDRLVLQDECGCNHFTL